MRQQQSSAKTPNQQPPPQTALIRPAHQTGATLSEAELQQLALKLYALLRQEWQLAQERWGN